MVQLSRPSLPVVGSSAKSGSEGFSLRTVITIIYRRRWVILAIALPLIIIGGTNLFGQTGTYTASARVVVDLGRVDLPKWRPGLQDVDYNRDLNTLVTSAMSLPVAQSAAVALHDSIPVIQRLDDTLLDLDQPGVLADYLLGGLDVSVMGESSVMNFQFASSRPRISLMAVEALRKAFLEFQIYGKKNEKAVEYYLERADHVRTAMDSLLESRASILSKAGYASVDEEFRYNSGQLAEAENDLRETEATRRSMEAQIIELRQYLDGDPRDFPMGPDENRTSTLVYLMNRLAMHDDQLTNLLTYYTENSVPVSRQREVVKEAAKRLAQEEQNFVDALALDLTLLKEKESTLQEQVDSLRKRNSRAPEVYRQVTLIDSELKSLYSLLDDLQVKIGEVSLATYADERISGMSSLDSASIATVFGGSTTLIYFIALVIISLSLGFLAGFVAENLDHRVYSPVDVEENLKLPVFASVTRIE